LALGPRWEPKVRRDHRYRSTGVDLDRSRCALVLVLPCGAAGPETTVDRIAARPFVAETSNHEHIGLRRRRSDRSILL
jgi:hypothetical protein